MLTASLIAQTTNGSGKSTTDTVPGSKSSDVRERLTTEKSFSAVFNDAQIVSSLAPSENRQGAEEAPQIETQPPEAEETTEKPIETAMPGDNPKPTFDKADSEVWVENSPNRSNLESSVAAGLATETKRKETALPVTQQLLISVASQTSIKQIAPKVGETSLPATPPRTESIAQVEGERSQSSENLFKSAQPDAVDNEKGVASNPDIPVGPNRSSEASTGAMSKNHVLTQTRQPNQQATLSEPQAISPNPPTETKPVGIDGPTKTVPKDNPFAFVHSKAQVPGVSTSERQLFTAFGDNSKQAEALPLSEGKFAPSNAQPQIDLAGRAPLDQASQPQISWMASGGTSSLKSSGLHTPNANQKPANAEPEIGKPINELPRPKSQVSIAAGMAETTLPEQVSRSSSIPAPRETDLKGSANTQPAQGEKLISLSLSTAPKPTEQPTSGRHLNSTSTIFQGDKAPANTLQTDIGVHLGSNAEHVNDRTASLQKLPNGISNTTGHANLSSIGAQDGSKLKFFDPSDGNSSQRGAFARTSSDADPVLNGTETKPIPPSTPQQNQPQPVSDTNRTITSVPGMSSKEVLTVPDNLESRTAETLVVENQTRDPASFVPTNRMETARAVASQIAATITRNPDSSSIDIALDPEELGSVKITLRSSSDGMTVSILAERPETLEMMRRHIDELSREFRELGMNSLEFSFAEHGNDPNGDHDRQFTSAPERSSDGLPQSDEPTPSRIVAGGLDIRL